MSKENPACILCSEEEETIFHIVFECEVLARRQFNLLGLVNPGEEIPMKNLVNTLLDPIKAYFTHAGSDRTVHSGRSSKVYKRIVVFTCAGHR
jgi:hypothetical protein